MPICLLCGKGRFLYSELHRRSIIIRAATVFFVLAFTTSSILSSDPPLSFQYAAVSVMGFVCCGGLWSCINRRIQSALVLYAILGSVFSIYTYLEGVSIQGRLSFGATGHPNFLGLICFGILVCSLATRNMFLRTTLVAINFAVIIQTQARSCLLASVISILVFILLTHTHKKIRSSAAIVVLGSLGITGIAFYLLYQQETVDFISNLLFLNDRYRGFGTGFTGRLDAWHEAYQMFLANPVFGIGFRTHEQYMTTLSSAHNGYLSTLAETGAFGIVTILSLICICSRRLYKVARAGDEVAIVGFAFVVGYLFVSMFERFLVNFGSPTSALMWIFLFMFRGPNPLVLKDVGKPRLAVDSLAFAPASDVKAW